MSDNPMPKAGKEEVTPALVESILARSRKGLETYGTPLRTRNGRCAITDLRDELLDAAQYCQQLEMERNEMLDALARFLAIASSGRHVYEQVVYYGWHADVARILANHGRAEIVSEAEVGGNGAEDWAIVRLGGPQ